jgi:hypothetical protein
MSVWDKFRTTRVLRPGDRGAPPIVSRRAFLGGAGAVVTLPLFESLDARAATAPRPVRAIWWYAPCGIEMAQWRVPNGPLNNLSRILAPLEAVKASTLVLTGLDNTACMVPVAGDHARGTGSFLTCRTVEHSTDSIINGISVDQVAANVIGAQTSFKSLELGTTGGSSVGDCDSGYSCAYTRNISWIDSNTPNPKITDGGIVFDRLFSGFDQSLTAEQLAARKLWRKSVLDYVLDDANALKTRLGVSDREKLDEYLSGIRSLEVRIDAEQPGCIPSDRPEPTVDYGMSCDVMSDLTVLALQCDLTRLVTFMLENGGSYRSWDFLNGVVGAHHELSHHQGDPTKIEALARIGTYQIERFAYLAERLQNTLEPDGSSLLDHSTLFFSSEISDGDWHNHDDLPVVMVGGAGGAIRTGRHVDLGSRPIADLYLSMLEVVGAPQSSFGIDGTAAIDLA